jgi:hypothetical protein
MLGVFCIIFFTPEHAGSIAQRKLHAHLIIFFVKKTCKAGNNAPLNNFKKCVRIFSKEIKKMEMVSN